MLTVIPALCLPLVREAMLGSSKSRNTENSANADACGQSPVPDDNLNSARCNCLHLRVGSRWINGLLGILGGKVNLLAAVVQ